MMDECVQRTQYPSSARFPHSIVVHMRRSGRISTSKPSPKPAHPRPDGALLAQSANRVRVRGPGIHYIRAHAEAHTSGIKLGPSNLSSTNLAVFHRPKPAVQQRRRESRLERRRGRWPGPHRQMSKLSTTTRPWTSRAGTSPAGLTLRNHGGLLLRSISSVACSTPAHPHIVHLLSDSSTQSKPERASPFSRRVSDTRCA
jgi:hypothetical protein